ncbi:MAG: RHS repeat-associated core domain-containing protein [Paludibacteraceae bacterium]|nr:RHS repeat-associated core domain-containing protein [Paludibacteraceae bacterium]
MRREQNQAMLGLCRAEACLRAKHNGKELDAETGLYYYGARYYDPTTALWLGVDPLAEKYPGVSPYVYCHGNPVVLIDEDGCESRSFDDKVGDVLRDVTGMHSEIQEAKSVQPLAEGAALLNPVIGIANNVKTLATGAEKVVSAIGSACASKIEKVADAVNKITTFVSAGLTIYRV